MDTLYTVTQVRAVWFAMNLMARHDEQFQKLGCVAITYLLDKYPKDGVNFELISKMGRTAACTPMRGVAHYIICHERVWSSVIELGTYVVGPYIKLRTRMISGTCCR